VIANTNFELVSAGAPAYDLTKARTCPEPKGELIDRGGKILLVVGGSCVIVFVEV